jgi:hypothetical protein
MERFKTYRNGTNNRKKCNRLSVATEQELPHKHQIINLLGTCVATLEFREEHSRPMPPSSTSEIRFHRDIDIVFKVGQTRFFFFNYISRYIVFFVHYCPPFHLHVHDLFCLLPILLLSKSFCLQRNREGNCH